MEQAVITGIGIVSVLGLDRRAVGNSLYEGKTGLVHDPVRKQRGFQSDLTGRIEGFQPDRFLSRKERKTMPLFAVQAHAAAMDALLQAGLAPSGLATERCGLIFGNDSSVLSAIEQWEAFNQANSTSRLGSGHVFRGMTSTVTLNLNALFGMKGASWSLSAACASGLHAIGQAADLIRLGRQDIMLCGGAQELCMEALPGFDGLGAFSVNENPDEASRPFDAKRDGLVPSGGAAALLLESSSHAKQRGARILGEICGFGYSSDGSGLSAPSPEGLSRAMRMALQEAKWNTVDVVSAHATSTPVGDAAEATNLRRLFGAACPPVMALKSLTGHELWMSGAGQVVYSLIMAEQGFTAATRNFLGPDDTTAGIPILTRRREEPPKRVLCNAAGFGGVNASLALEIA